MRFSLLTVPELNERSCLLRSSALEKIRTTSGEVIVLHYALQPHPAFTDPDDSMNSVVGTIGTKAVVDDLYVGASNGNPRSIDPKWFLESELPESGHITIFDQVGCNVKDVKKFICAFENVPPTPPNPALRASQNPQPSPALMIPLNASTNAPQNPPLEVPPNASPNPSTNASQNSRSRAPSNASSNSPPSRYPNVRRAFRRTRRGASQNIPLKVVSHNASTNSATGVSQPSFSPSASSTVMDSHSLCDRSYPKNPKTFITGISFVASASETKFLTLLVSIPYLGLGFTVSRCGSRTLLQYRHQLFEDDVPNVAPRRRILVHQTWFLLFNNETIGIFRSKNDEYNNLAPLFPYQQREGVFHALVHMISNTLTLSETEVLEHFRMLVTEWESNYPRSKEPNNEGSTPGTAMFELGSYITDLCTMMQVTRSQIKYLEDLRQIFQTSYHSDFGRWPHSNQFEIPFMENNKEQMRKVMTSFTTILAQREKFSRDLKHLVEELEILQNVFLRSAQADSQQSTAIAVKRQGETITLFTFLTSIFLPLGFFASYFAISPDGYQSSIKSPGDFWRISGPVTGCMFVFFIIFMCRPDSDMKKVLGRIGRFSKNEK